MLQLDEMKGLKDPLRPSSHEQYTVYFHLSIVILCVTIARVTRALERQQFQEIEKFGTQDIGRNTEVCMLNSKTPFNY